MQFFLNGFRPGDPANLASGNAQLALAEVHSLPERRTLPSHVDVLIVGSGPTGLTLASQLSAFPGVVTCIIEQKPGPLFLGQADGIACRTMEMFEAFGFSERVLKESYWVNETCFWEPSETRSEHVVRSKVIQDVADGLSEFPHTIINQARIHDFYLEQMRRAPAPLEPDYARRLVDVQFDRSVALKPEAYPLTATIEGADELGQKVIETVRARYLVGCDGARSAVRTFIGAKLRGDSARQAWGVMDILAVSDFPDIRRKAAIHSAAAGSMLIIPREGGYMIRMYVELGKLAKDQRVAQLQVTTAQLIATAQQILNPFTLDVKEIVWWSVYEIAQRLCEQFDDLPLASDAGQFPRRFIAGDSCHTHSPKAGQGMNVSMQDAFNLGWKLASVLSGRASPQLLRTYSSERRAVAKELIEFDYEFARQFSARPNKSAAGHDTVDTADFQEYFVRHGQFTAGTATRYAPSEITGPATHQDLAQGFAVGTRFHSALVIRWADARPIHLGHRVRADGRWRIIAFADAGTRVAPAVGLRDLCGFLHESAASPLLRYTSRDADVDSVIEVIAVYQQAHAQLFMHDMPSVLLPRKGRFQLIDYEKIYCPDLKSGSDIFELRRIDRSLGALVIVRPDQYVAHVLPLDAHDELTDFFERFMRAPL